MGIASSGVKGREAGRKREDQGTAVMKGDNKIKKRSILASDQLAT